MPLPLLPLLLDSASRLADVASRGVDTSRLMCTGLLWSPKGDQTQRENWYWTGLGSAGCACPKGVAREAHNLAGISELGKAQSRDCLIGMCEQVTELGKENFVQRLFRQRSDTNFKRSSKDFMSISNIVGMQLSSSLWKHYLCHIRLIKENIYISISI